MLERRTIDREIELDPALDYAALRAEGLRHIQKLSGLIWTDHNAHDPGITTLEILCYALTDLAYRARFEVRDLLTDENGRIDPSERSGLGPAHQVLTTAPRTIADYRRLLLRIEGVRNAWLDPMTDPAEPENYRLSEVPVYADCLSGALSFGKTNAAGEANHPVRLSGLYKVLIELEIDEELGPLNETALTYRVRRGPLKGVVLALDSADPALTDGTLDLSAAIAEVESVSVSSRPGGFAVRLTLKMAEGGTVTLEDCTLRVIEDRPRPGEDPLDVTAQAVRGVLLAAGGDDLVPLFWKKQRRRAGTLRAVACALHAHRGLCEDFLSIATVAPQRVGICADIEVTPGADLEKVQAAVYHGIEKYLSAPVRYRTLREMLEEGREADEVFNGPFVDFAFTCDGAPVFTKPGFVTDADLAASELRRRIHASDIINIVVDIEGVEAIRNVQLRAYDATGRAVGGSAKWTLQVPPDHQPVFHHAGSKILFHRAGIPYRAQATEFERTLDHLRALDRREVYVPPDQVLPMPVGRWRHLDAFYSVQHDFPATYKIGTAGISDTEPPERIARARQMKGYLAFFDQVLADYLGQLANLRRLYSLDRDLTRSWFSQKMTGIAGSLAAFDDEFYTDKAAIADEETRTRLNESEEVFFERRNRVLDHLIARFAERFADYALLSFRLSGDRLKTSAELIEEKIDFLSAYPKLSRERGQGANIRPESPALIWDSDNISGLERRAGMLLGINNLARRDLHCAGHFGALLSTLKSGDAFRVAIRDAENRLLFASAETFADRETALDAAAQAYPALRDEDAFEIAAEQGTTTFRLSITSGPSPLTHNKSFDTEMDATLAARAIIDRYDEILQAGLCAGDEAEGMHLIEHILLRPRAEGDPLMDVCLCEDCVFCGEQDPYSFRVSVVLPYWPERFRNAHFRALVERTLREEAPAHVQLRICWIGQRQMTELDAAYRAWATARAAARPNPATIRSRTARLVAILDSLSTMHPAASLHDCGLGEDETVVRLGSSALGIF